MTTTTPSAYTADRLPLQQVAEMSAPRTCPDRVPGCPAVAEIPVSASGWDAGLSCVVTAGGCGIGRVLVQATRASSRTEMNHGRAGDGDACVRTAHQRAAQAAPAAARPPRGGFPGSAFLTGPRRARCCAGRYTRARPMPPGFSAGHLPGNRGVDVITWGVPVGTRSVPRRCRGGPDADQRRTSR
jgi:hypothetical protein